jgi:predicted transcriptional regulator
VATSIKLPPKLKTRVAAASKRAGKSPHAFMLEAIEQQTGQAERWQRFVADALAAEKDALETGLGFPADEVHAFADARARGEKPKRPRAKSWRK